MAKDKTKPTEQAKEDPLTRRVDEMMDVRRPDPSAAAADAPAKSDKTPPPLDIFKDAPTAPKLPPKLLKEIEEETSKDDGEKITVSRVAAKKPESTKQEVPDSTEPEVADKTVEALPEEAESAEIDNPDTDKAVQDIVAKEGDEVLAVEDAQTKQASQPPTSGHGWKAKLGGFFKNKWTWVGLAVVLVALFAVPVTRYKILGLFLKSPTEVIVLDSKTATPVSNAVVTIGGASGKTDGTGTVKFRAPLGNHKLAITKQYYQSYDSPYFVGFSSGPGYKVQLLATGRQVPVMVVDRITGKPLGNVEIKVLDTNAKTNARGKSTIVLPTHEATQDAVVSLSGYNVGLVKIQVTDKVVNANTVKLVPSGQVYFLSNLSGKLDVVKTNLDGTARKVVLAGTGKEDAPNVSLLASKDWKYLVLESARDDGQHPALYLIDTSSDEVTKFESSDSRYAVIGWHDHDFLYDVTKNGVSTDQKAREQVKSYDADHHQTNLLLQNDVDQNSKLFQAFGSFYVVDSELVYISSWYTNGSNLPDATPHTNTVTGFSLNTDKKTVDYGEIPARSGYFSLRQYEPNGLYFQQNSGSDTGYFKIEDGKASPASDLNFAQFNQAYPTFLQSPSGSQTFWADYRDGKNTLFTGNSGGDKQKQIASLSDYSPYGWYTDNYLLVSKSNSELYVMSTAGGTPLKISDYYKPQQTFRGYGGGYGGL